MRVSAVSSLSSMANCMMKIEVTHMSSQITTRSGKSTIKVPFSSLSRTMQFIHRSGGKVVDVVKLATATALVDLPQIEQSVTRSIAPTNPPAATPTTTPPSDQQRSKRGGKRK